MRKRRNLFLESLFALVVIYAILACLKLPDLDASLLLGRILGGISLLILLPFAFANLPFGRPLRGACHLAIALSPLIIAFSHPAIAIFTVPCDKLNLFLTLMAEHRQWLVNSMANIFFVFVIGLLFSSIIKKKEEKWLRPVIAVFVLTLSYLFIAHLFQEPSGEPPFFFLRNLYHAITSS